MSKELHFTFNLVAMPIVVDVTLMSGQGVSLETYLTASIQSLEKRARNVLGVGRGRLLSSSGAVLDGETQLGAAKLQTGDCLTLQVGTVRICGGSSCFAAILVMGLSSHGALRILVVTAVPCKTG